MKRFFTLLLFALMLFCTSCLGYNSIMYDYLSKEENYLLYEGILASSPAEFVEGEELLLSLQLEKTYIQENANLFYHSRKEGEYYLSSFTICAENAKILYENHFFDEVEKGTVLRFRATSWIYMDGNFLFICAIESNGIEYLRVEEGMNNITLLMEANRSLL